VQELGLLDKLDFAEGEIKSDLKISHKLIKELNTVILVENYKKRVIDANGDQFFVDVIVGEYKTKNNHVQRRDGGIFNFAEAVETQALMQDLIDRYEKNKHSLHPLILASMFHYKFIRIHPFDDGNGRVCRLLVNMILMNAGYPLFMVPMNQKDEYYDILEYMDKQYPSLYDAINSTDSEKYTIFTDYLAQRVLWSVDQMIEIREEKSDLIS
jgi:Fic family protein